MLNPRSSRLSAGLRAASWLGLITDGEESRRGEPAAWAWWTGIVTERLRVSLASLR